ncbi:hypothetical protein NDU88_004665 [Pleurodeles waltl]|uniref:Uncharacterized protein n=1 Tax=Pleurodeles waltl TaxID=8319 RepID=A0AAV7LIY4_PLEWA|nr:hypothetical protein NDU88_004665 [Pleurodeles waltl]
MLLFPAKLQVVHGGQSKFFTSPEDVWNWLDMVHLQDKIGVMERPQGSYRGRRDRLSASAERSRWGMKTTAGGPHVEEQQDGMLAAQMAGSQEDPLGNDEVNAQSQATAS